MPKWAQTLWPTGAPAPLSLFSCETQGTHSLTCFLPFTAHLHVLFQPSIYSTHIRSALTLSLVFPHNYITFFFQIILTNSYLPSSLFIYRVLLPSHPSVSFSSFIPIWPLSAKSHIQCALLKSREGERRGGMGGAGGDTRTQQSSNFNLSLFTSTQNVAENKKLSKPVPLALWTTFFAMTCFAWNKMLLTNHGISLISLFAVFPDRWCAFSFLFASEEFLQPRCSWVFL